MRLRDGGGDHEHLGGQDAARARGVGQQLLAEHRLQDEGELDADLLDLMGREDVDDAVDGLGAIGGVQGGEDQVAGLGDGQRGADGLQVAHLADQDHVRGPGAGRAAAPARRSRCPAPTSRWLTRLFLWVCTYSMGSSTVTMWTLLRSLM